MKKILKIVAIIFALIFGIGLIGLALETPEQKAEREAKALQEKQNQSTKIENDGEQAKIIESKKRVLKLHKPLRLMANQIFKLILE